MVDIFEKDSKYPQCTPEASSFYLDISQRIRDIVEIGSNYGFTEKQIKKMVINEISDRFAGNRLHAAYTKLKG